MSTRANVIIKEGNAKLYFYRHSDGYPDGTLPALNKFMEWLKEGKIRDNISQSAGWLIIIGALEYQTIPVCKNVEKSKYSSSGDPESIEAPTDWKAGAFEPTTGLHGDIEWLYTIDLDKKELTYREA